MCAQRMFRSTSSSDTVSSAPEPIEDQRQGVLDLGPPRPSESETPDQIAHRLAYALADFRSKLALGEARGDRDRFNRPPDRVARLAHRFMRHLAEVKSIPGGRKVDDFDALDANACIAMIAEEANELINALIFDAESHGLEASGAWMQIPLVECREFEVPSPKPDAREADDIHDRKLNS